MARPDSSPALLPYRWRFAGMALFAMSLILAAWYLVGDAQLQLPVFAVVSSFFEVKWFVVYATNVFDEIAMLVALTGCFLMVFSKERNELAAYEAIRLRCWFDAVKYNMIFLMLVVVFVYGTGFIVVLVANMVSCMLLYLILFSIRKRGVTTED